MKSSDNAFLVKCISDLACDETETLIQSYASRFTNDASRASVAVLHTHCLLCAARGLIYQDAEKECGVAGTIPVLAQRAASEECERAGRPFFLLAEPPR